MIFRCSEDANDHTIHKCSPSIMVLARSKVSFSVKTGCVFYQTIWRCVFLPSLTIFVYPCFILITIILPLFILIVIGDHAVDQRNVKTIVLVLIRLSLSCKSEYFQKFSIFILIIYRYIIIIYRYLVYV